MGVECHGHVFVPFKSVESICWACGFVTWTVETPEEADRALRDLGGGTCPGHWHGRHGPLPGETITGVALLSAHGELYQLPAPNRHHDVIAMMVRDGEGEHAADAEQGFVTSADRFLDRRAALVLALSSGQIKEEDRPVPGLPELFSEDLW